MIDLNRIPNEILNLPDEKFNRANRDHVGDEGFQTAPIGFFKDSFVRLSKNRVSMFSLSMIVIIILLAIFAPGFNEYTYVQQHVTLINMPARIPILENFGIADGRRLITNRRLTTVMDPDVFNPDSIIEIMNHRMVSGVEVVDVMVDYYEFMGADDMYFWFGSDYLGRDLFTRLFRGARTSLVIAFVAVFINLIIGVVFGSVAGYYGGKADMLMMRAVEVLEGVPYLVMVTFFMLLFGAGMRSIILALVVTGWTGVARLIRAQFYRFKGREYVLAARTLGVPDIILIFRHILPNSLGPIITRTMIAIPGAIFSEAFLAYIGLGLAAPETSIGVLLSDGQKVLLQYPNQTFFPAVLISVLMISFNLFSNGLRDALDPSRRGREGG